MGKYYYFRDKQGYFKLAYTSEGKRVIDKQDTGKSSYEINLHLPDGTVFPALFPQTGFKALETDPQSILVIWILNVLGITNPQRVKYDKSAINVVTMDSLE